MSEENLSGYYCCVEDVVCNGPIGFPNCRIAFEVRTTAMAAFLLFAMLKWGDALGNWASRTSGANEQA